MPCSKTRYRVSQIVFIPNPSIGKPAIEFRFKHALFKLMLQLYIPFHCNGMSIFLDVCC